MVLFPPYPSTYLLQVSCIKYKSAFSESGSNVSILGFLLLFPDFGYTKPLGWGLIWCEKEHLQAETARVWCTT